MLIYDEKRYLSQFVSEMFDSLQLDSTKGTPQYELISFVTMATYWVPDLPKVFHMNLKICSTFGVVRSDFVLRRYVKQLHRSLQLFYVGSVLDRDNL